MTDQNSDNKISNIIKTIRSLSLLWDLDELLKEVIKNSVTILNADFGYLLLLESNGLVVKSQWSEPNINTESYLPEIAEKVIRHGLSIYAQGLLDGQYPNSQVYCVPLITNRGVLGVIYVQTIDKKDEITVDEKALFEMLGLQAASFLENAILYHSAITDPLTGLYSHRHFQQESDQMIRRATRTQSPISLMILDLDHFKQLNDNFGHEAGNICLKRISEILKSKFRATDVIARFGGDEFEILLSDATTEKSVVIAKDIIDQISKENFPLQISGTIGIATYPINALDSQSLFLAADQALYDGKQKGRNCVSIAKTIAKKEIEIPSQINDSLSFKQNDLNNIQTTLTENIKKDIQRIDGLDIINRIASSSNGEVMLAKQYELDRLVALKRPLTANLTEEQSVAFKKEAFITASLSHPGVVPLYSMGRGIDGRLYYTMKPIGGLSLAELLQKLHNKDAQTIKEYSLFKLIHILLKASETIAYAHSKNVLHLDIHPGNITIGEFGEITIIDWGKGIKLKDKIKELNSNKIYFSGSPIYCPPEQIVNGTVGKFSDIYSLGIILFEILTNKIPFQRNSSKATFESIILGIENSSEIEDLNKGIDPLLEKTCRSAIVKDSDARISAIDFAKALTRYVMQEADIKVHLFNTKETPMADKDWVSIVSNTKVSYANIWSFNNGVWSSLKEGFQNLLFWNTPITGNFSFTCEAWVTKSPRELAFVCFGRIIKNTSGYLSVNEQFNGYYFQFGADGNIYTKLARHAHDVLIDSKFKTEINRKYIIVISYQDGWLNCYIDKTLVFNYRELHPFNGQYIGFYGFSDGSHYRPIEISYQSTGLMVPAIRLADEQLENNQFEKAINRYNDIIQAFPDRLEGYESILKRGVCFTRQGKQDEALSSYNQLKNTILEPFALSEMALMELPENETEIADKKGDYYKAFLIFKQLFDKYPQHQATFRILEPCTLLRNTFESNSFNSKKSWEETINAKIALFELGAKTITPPGQSQLNCYDSILRHMILLGKWTEAMSIIKNLIYKYNENIMIQSRQINSILYLCYSNDDWGFFKNNLFHKTDETITFDCFPFFILELFEGESVVEKYRPGIFRDSWKSLSCSILFNLKNNKEFCISIFYEENRNKNLPFEYRINKFRYNMDSLAIEMYLSNDSENIHDVLKYLKLFTDGSPHAIEETNFFQFYYLAINDLFLLNFDSTAKNIISSNQFNTVLNNFHEKRLLVSCLLYSLNYKTDQNKQELENLNIIYLAGPRLELATNFLKNEPFTLSDKWPKKPLDKYFDLVLYSIWLYEKKEYQQLDSMFNYLLNPILGNAFFQSFLNKLKSGTPARKL